MRRCTTYPEACALLHRYFTQHTACRDASVTTAIMGELFSGSNGLFMQQHMQKLEAMCRSMGRLPVTFDSRTTSSFDHFTDCANQELQRKNSLLGIHRRTTKGRDLLRAKTLELWRPYVDVGTKLEKRHSSQSFGY